MTHRGSAVTAFIVLALGASVYAAYGRIAEEHNARVRAELFADSVAAEADSVVMVLRGALNVAGDSVNLYRRRAVQIELVNDSLAREVGIQVAARTSLSAVVDSLHTEVLGVLGEGPDGVQQAEFDFHEPPYRVWAHVTMSAPPTLQLRLALDPVPLVVGVGCEATRPDGVTPAYALVETPDWVTVNVLHTIQTAEVCNPGIFDAPSLWDGLSRHAVRGVALAGSAYVAWRLVQLLF